MKPLALLFRTSLGRKYLMSVTGIILALFVLGHMIGNLLFFQGPDAINLYAYRLKSLGGLLWAVRIGLLITIVIHVGTAIVLTIGNKRARPQGYSMKDNAAATFASRTMRMTGVLLLLFVIYHLLHYTALVIDPSYKNLLVQIPGVEGIHPDVYSMIVAGFSVWWVSLFYVFSMLMLCAHLTHGFSSLFQSLGIRNERWRYRLNKIALTLGVLIFIGFSSIPVSVLTGIMK